METIPIPLVRVNRSGLFAFPASLRMCTNKQFSGTHTYAYTYRNEDKGGNS